jgi:hypothetical protein
MKLQPLAFHTVLATPPFRDPSQTHLYRNVEKQGNIRPKAASGGLVHGLKKLQIKSPAAPLVGQGGIGIAITKDDFFLLKSRPDDLLDMLRPIGQEKQQFGRGS